METLAHTLTFANEQTLTNAHSITHQFTRSNRHSRTDEKTRTHSLSKMNTFSKMFSSFAVANCNRRKRQETVLQIAICNSHAKAGRRRQYFEAYSTIAATKHNRSLIGFHVDVVVVVANTPTAAGAAEMELISMGFAIGIVNLRALRNNSRLVARSRI